LAARIFSPTGGTARPETHRHPRPRPQALIDCLCDRAGHTGIFYAKQGSTPARTAAANGGPQIISILIKSRSNPIKIIVDFYSYFILMLRNFALNYTSLLRVG